jgi:hypothetical protein
MLRVSRRPGTATPSADPSPHADAAASQHSELDLLPAPDSAELTPELAARPSGQVELARSETPPIQPPVPMERPAPTPQIAARAWQPPRRGSRDRPPPREATEGATQAEAGVPAIERVATAPQLRRFIKSRAYVPMHELRRRFAINGGDDDVTPVELERSRVYVGLPEREGRLLGELLRGGDIGYELSLDPISPIVVGVYPMRPVTRG